MKEAETQNYVDWPRSHKKPMGWPLRSHILKVLPAQTLCLVQKLEFICCYIQKDIHKMERLVFSSFLFHALNIILKFYDLYFEPQKEKKSWRWKKKKQSFFYFFLFLFLFIFFSFFLSLSFFLFFCLFFSDVGMLWSIYKHLLAKVNFLLCEYIG